MGRYIQSPDLLSILAGVTIDAGGSAAVAAAAGNLWKMNHLAAVLERANQAGVEVVVLKGAALLGWLYRLEERPMADVDLLIRPADRDALVRALAPHGRLLSAHTERLIVGDYESGQFGIDFMGLALDVHTHILASPWLRRLVPLDEEGMWRRSLPISILGQSTRRLTAEDQLLHFATHTTFHHWEPDDSDRHRVADSRRLVEQGEIRWRLLQDLARAQRIRTATWVHLSNAHLRDLVPADVLHGLAPSWPAAIRIALAKHLGRRGDRSMAPVLLSDSNLGILRAIATILVPSDEWLQRRYATAPTRRERAMRHGLRVVAYIMARARGLLSRPPTSAPRAGQRSDRLRPAMKVRLFARIWFLLAVTLFNLRMRPLPVIVASLGIRGQTRTDRVPPRLLGQIVVRVLRLALREPRCLYSALIHYALLREQGDDPVLIIGLPLNSTNNEAHAWIEIDGADVGPPPGRGGRLALARYS